MDSAINFFPRKMEDIYNSRMSFKKVLIIRGLNGVIMICLRCGRCCIDLDVAIVNPESIQPDATINPKERASMIFKSKGRPCPHLDFRGDEALCKIHELPCYEGTPCRQFDQMGATDDLCMMNSYFRSVQDNPDLLGNSKGFKRDPKAN